jgi:hypothetical protein
MNRLVPLHLLLVSTAMTLAFGCAPHRIPVALGSIDEPRASWRIRAGKALEEREVCRSDVDQPCVIHVSSQDEPVSVVVSVYLHPVSDAKTTYQGAFFAGFMAGATNAGYERHVEVTIEPGRKPTGLTVSGHVTATPGQYFFKMALLAEVPMHTDPHQFEQNIPVKVIAS